MRPSRAAHLAISLCLVVAVAIASTASSPRVALADPPRAPTLAALGRHVEAELELRALVASLSPSARDRITGLYVAFDHDANDVFSLAACDDDGDYVVVVTDALLSLVESVTHAVALDEIGAQYTLLTLADFYAREQRPHERLLPPPAGTFVTADAREVEVAHTLKFRQALSGILAREIAPMLSGDLTCPHPTATRESGDDVWTDDERSAAISNAAALYADAQHRARDDVATLSLLARVGHEPAGYVAWLAFHTRVEAARVGVVWSYSRTHGSAAVRLHRTAEIILENKSAARDTFR